MVYPVFLRGWSSNRNYAFVGAVRVLFMALGYEVVLTVGIISVLIVKRSHSLHYLTNHWVCAPVLCFSGLFIVWFIALLRETQRTPFDMGEAESELVAGWMTEYRGVLFTMIILGEYLAILWGCELTANLFGVSSTFSI